MSAHVYTIFDWGMVRLATEALVFTETDICDMRSAAGWKDKDFKAKCLDLTEKYQPVKLSTSRNNYLYLFAAINLSVTRIEG